MSFLLLTKGFILLLATFTAVIALVRLGKKKDHFQIFPDDIKKEYFKEARMMTLLNVIAVFLIFIAFFFIHSNFFFIIVLFSMFLTSHSLIQIEELFGDFHDEDKKKRK